MSPSAFRGREQDPHWLVPGGNLLEAMGQLVGSCTSRLGAELWGLTSEPDHGVGAVASSLVAPDLPQIKGLLPPLPDPRPPLQRNRASGEQTLCCIDTKYHHHRTARTGHHSATHRPGVARVRGRSLVVFHPPKVRKGQEREEGEEWPPTTHPGGTALLVLAW